MTSEKDIRVLKERLTEPNYKKLMQLKNAKMHRFVAESVELCNPGSVFVCTDSPEDIACVRRKAVETGEEKKLAAEGHTVHYDGYYDQARDKEQTKYLLAPSVNLGTGINSIEKEVGLSEVREFFKDSMVGREVFVRFFCLGPTNSEFSIPCVQITDSSYVAHSEDLLYRPGYEHFKRIGDSEDFFRFLHTEGKLEDGVSVDVDKRRVYIDLEENVVYSTNTQYAGNTVGLKKLSLRLAIRKASVEGWLAEHMFIMGVHGPGERVTYFAGAFPSACGKTSTAMLPGETIVGDDIAYFRKHGGTLHAANVESGIFGIIRDVNPKDDPVIWDVLTRPGEVIFSNVLVTDGVPYWLGDGRECPQHGVNHSGKWTPGKKDAEGSVIDLAHKNARYTIRIGALKNCDPRLNDPEGVPIGGIVYGGRDSDTWVPVEQSFDWAHGMITKGASLESETTAATLGQEGVRKFNPMSNLDFVSIPISDYLQNNLAFAEGLDYVPPIFSVNYFLKDREGRYLNGMLDKMVWVKWMELRVNGDVEAIRTPTGLIPQYDDLRRLFKQHLSKDYTEQDYVDQFTVRIPESLAKIDRIEKIYRTDVRDTPQVFFDTLREQRERLARTREERGNYVSPLDLCPDTG